MDLGAFLLVSLAVIVVPGVDMALTTRQVLLHGRRAGLVTVAGLVTGGLLHTTFAVLGLSAVLATSATAFTVVKIAGAVYLLHLGIASLRSARRPTTADLPPPPPRSAYRSGLLTNLLNPKVAVFFLTFLPQFVDPGRPLAPQLLILSALFVVLATAWLVGFVLLLSRLRDVMARPRVRRRVEAVSGMVLVGMGARLATSR
jgi:threonine/homoserine/homoserine lactone efflux protein